MKEFKYYQNLFTKLVFTYAKHQDVNICYNSICQAQEAFTAITGLDWHEVLSSHLFPKPDTLQSSSEQGECQNEKTEYWYLREGDFLPEPVETLCQSWHRNRQSIIEFLSKSNNIFHSKEGAMKVSQAVRDLLATH